MHCSSIGGAGAVPRLWFDRGTLLLDALDGEQVRALFGRDAWAWDGRVGAWRSDAIHYAAVRRALRERFGRGWQDEVPGPPPVRWPKVDLPPLRPEQQEALAAWRAAGRCGQVVMPTGTGKTEVALAAMAETGAATRARLRLRFGYRVHVRRGAAWRVVIRRRRAMGEDDETSREDAEAPAAARD